MRHGAILPAQVFQNRRLSATLAASKAEENLTSTASDLKSEIAQLKLDAEATLKPRKPRSPRETKQADPAPREAPVDDAEAQTGELKELVDKLTGLVEDAETEIKERPVTMVLGAFALGVVVGALLRR